jgi:pyruvate/2-oxoglutarate dehydrogenase complex dihydrolipoamide dehydrogenase (E3) component
MAQAFQAFGSEVTLIDVAERPLPRGDVDASAVLAKTLEQDGVELRLGAGVEQVSLEGEDTVLKLSDGSAVRCDRVLVAVGRQPNLESLDLGRANIAYDKRGVIVEDTLRTSNPNVYAAGDVASKFQFTHAADAMARIVVQNAMFFGGKRQSALVIPSTTYTMPEVAQVGLSTEEADRREDVTTYRVDYTGLDRMIADGHTEGFVKVHANRSGTILGASIVGPRAGELISTISLAMTNQVGLGGFATTIHPYPTEAEALRKVGDAWNKTRLTPTAASVLKTVLAWRR